MKPRGFSKFERIKKSCEFKKVHKKGTSCKDGVFVLKILKNNLGRHRLGLSISSFRVPLSSRRNRLKRIIREVFRINKTAFKKGTYDLVVSMKRPFDNKVNYTMVEKRLQALLKKTGIL